MTPNDPKQLHRRIEAAVNQAAGSGPPRRFAERVLAPLLAELGASERLRSVHLFERRDGRLHQIGQAGPEAPRLQEYLIHAGELAGSSWTGPTDAGPVTVFPVTTAEDVLLALVFEPGHDGDAALSSALATPIQYAVQHQLRRHDLEDAFERARAIQTSLLPPAKPEFGEFDILAFSRPAHEVGGDLYDFIRLDESTLGIAVADASGHGLPAALQARDVITGLRMGAERDLRLTRTVEKLNRVIHRSGLTSRFVSLVFAELEDNGTLLYVNAGHPPPLLCDDGGVHDLSIGGTLLGPWPEAAYKMGFAHIDRGAMLVLYTDGVIERRSRSGEMFGAERLRAWLLEHREQPATSALDDLTRALDAHSGRTQAEDDTTIVIVRRPQG
jgi:sigma-B regulation protein RsbU (phosphoserine phosphatase)